jgi:precorrin-2 dehydrogenase/sirohydrochlorin ferrochelatase
MKYFPIYLDLKDRNILVVGAGHEAESKVLQLLQTGAQLKLISDTQPHYLTNFKKYKNFAFEQRKFSAADLQGAWLVISTLEDRNINEYIYSTATERNILCNVVDVTDLCSFIFPAIVTQGDVNIAISTSGKSPALAQNIKEKISDYIGPEYGFLAEILGRKRKELIKKIPDKKERSKLFHRLVDSDALELLRQNRDYDAEKLISRIIKEEFKDTFINNAK